MRRRAMKTGSTDPASGQRRSDLQGRHREVDEALQLVARSHGDAHLQGRRGQGAAELHSRIPGPRRRDDVQCRQRAVGVAGRRRVRQSMGGQRSPTRDDHRVSKTLLDTLNALGDPRMKIFAQPTKNDPTKYVGLQNGLDNVTVTPFFNTTSRVGAIFYPGSTVYGTFGTAAGKTTPSYIMTYAEVEFIKAEAAERWLGGLPGAAAHYNAGVTRFDHAVGRHRRRGRCVPRQARRRLRRGRHGPEADRSPEVDLDVHAGQRSVDRVAPDGQPGDRSRWDRRRIRTSRRFRAVFRIRAMSRL